MGWGFGQGEMYDMAVRKVFDFRIRRYYCKRGNNVSNTIPSIEMVRQARVLLLVYKITEIANLTISVYFFGMETNIIQMDS